MSDLTVLTEVVPTDADLAAIEAESAETYVSIQNAPFEYDSLDFVTNGSYRNKSGALSDYFRKRCFVLVWSNTSALVKFSQSGTIYEVSRNHLTID